jgi:hypothetical protein
VVFDGLRLSQVVPNGPEPSYAHRVAFWVTELPAGGMAMGEAADEAEARVMIAREQGRASVNWSQRSMRYRWTVVLDCDHAGSGHACPRSCGGTGKTSTGWADTEYDAWWFVKEALNRPFRGTRYRGPRGLFSLPPQ